MKLTDVKYRQRVTKLGRLHWVWDLSVLLGDDSTAVGFSDDALTYRGAVRKMLQTERHIREGLSEAEARRAMAPGWYRDA